MIPESAKGKTCTRCSQELPLSAFARGTQYRDGLQYWCRDCSADAYRQRRTAMGKSVRRPREVPAGHKHCLQCDKTKPHDQWSRATRTKDGLATACKTCMAARGRRDYFKRTYGLTEERLQELLRAQRGVCAICLGPGPEHVDHDHISGRVRGLLCFRCNIALVTYATARTSSGGPRTTSKDTCGNRSPQHRASSCCLPHPRQLLVRRVPRRTRPRGPAEST